jgi:ATP-dependent Clp protease ATP-binding subunit ClpC
MFERFTDNARRAIVLAQEQSRDLGHDYIGTEHILLGLLAVTDGLAAKVLTASGVDLARTRAKVEDVIGKGQSQPVSHIPFTPRAKKVLELSLREALALHHNYIGTEHILLGLLREGEGVAGQILVAEGVALDDARAKVIEILQEGLS